MGREEVRSLVEDFVKEVDNGGFDQFFFNSIGDDAAAILDALVAVGAVKTAEIVRGAYSRFPGGMPPPDRFERQKLLEVLSPDGDAFGPEDDAFYASDEDLGGLLAAYVDR